ncbi:MAG: hypothetical protein M5U28_38105 [Sandaracinaceae bacterium]|nr:hypothetical protein [Sandaracinaceae bacterium]
MVHRTVALVVALASCAAASCGPARGATSALDARTTWTGRVTYEARHETPQGASAALETRPARFVDLALLDASGAVVAEGRTGEDGAFAIDGPAAAQRLRVYARTRVRGHDAAVARDALGRETHALEVALGAPEAALAAHAADAAGDAGAFHVVDTMLRGLDAVHEWTGSALPPVFVYWVRGGTREWSYYRGERPPGSGRYALELLGGDPGQQSISDTDEHDEAIILHELGHFVMDRLAGNSSSGGMHPRGARHRPGPRVGGGAGHVVRARRAGQPALPRHHRHRAVGRLRVDVDLERGEDPVPGIGSETSVSEILWDLGDGAGGLPDADEDGIALGPAAVLEAMMELAREEGTFACLASFLAHLAGGRVERDGLRAMLQRTGEPAEELLPDALPWPRTPGRGRGRVRQDRRPHAAGAERRAQPAGDGLRRHPHLPRARARGRDAARAARHRGQRAAGGPRGSRSRAARPARGPHRRLAHGLGDRDARPPRATGVVRGPACATAAGATARTTACACRWRRSAGLPSRRSLAGLSAARGARRGAARPRRRARARAGRS